MSIHRKPPEGNVRRVRSISGNLCGVMTNKIGRVVQFESFGERSLLLRLERDRTVKDYNSQPETFVYSGSNGRRCRYTPDFVVWRSTGCTEIHEVTLSERRLKPSAIGREGAAQVVCAERGWQYVVHTERDLPDGNELANLLRLYPYRVGVYEEKGVQESIRAWLTFEMPVSLTVLAARLKDETQLCLERVWGALFHQIWHSELEMDWQGSFLSTVADVQVWRERQE